MTRIMMVFQWGERAIMIIMRIMIIMMVLRGGFRWYPRRVLPAGQGRDGAQGGSPGRRYFEGA